MQVVVVSASQLLSGLLRKPESLFADLMQTLISADVCTAEQLLLPPCSRLRVVFKLGSFIYCDSK